MNSKTNQKTIAILEDDQEIRDIIELILDEENFNCEVLINQKSIDKLVKIPDLLVMDLQMEISIEDFLANMKNKFSKLPQILIVSASSEIREIAARLNISNYMEKPFCIDMFLERVKELTK